jgi:hypothetical protein
MHASSCVGTYDGLWHEDKAHGRGVFTSAREGWTYSGGFEGHRPTEGELVEADGRRFKVTYTKDCAFIFDNPKPKTKVGVVWCVVLRRRSCLRCAHVRVRQRACAVLGTA